MNHQYINECIIKFKSENNVNLSTSESLESMFNILFRITR